MATYNTKIMWQLKPADDFSSNRYSREHQWLFDGGFQISASSSPLVVPLPFSVESAIDPEEAFIASLASCHMLWFLSIASKKKFVVESYSDNATGEMGKNESGKVAMLKVELFPNTKFSSTRLPTEAELIEMHSKAHENCYIANSVNTTVTISPTM